MKPPLTRDELAKLVEDGLENGGYLMFRFGHGQIRQLRPDETEVVLAALKAAPPEVEAMQKELAELKQFVSDAFVAHPNLDLDIANTRREPQYSTLKGDDA